MTRADALTALRSLAQAAVSPTLTDDELNAALTVSRLVDNEGRPPSDPDFVEENWDLDYAAAECYDMKHAKILGSGQLLEFTAEGANFKKIPPNYLELAEWYRNRSTAGVGSGEPVFVELDNRVPRALRPRSSMES